MTAPGIVHSKLIIADDEGLSMGSANANQRGFFLDSELNVVLEHGKAVEDHDLPRSRSDPKSILKLMRKMPAIGDFKILC